VQISAKHCGFNVFGRIPTTRVCRDLPFLARLLHA
jgi:hypothetical protein